VSARVAVTGGEPMLSGSFWDLVGIFDSSQQVGMLTVLTNGTLIEERDAKKLASVSKLREVQVSLDGASPTTHDAIRGRGSFEAAMRGIRVLKGRQVPVAVMFTLSHANKADSVAILRLAQQEHVDYVTVERVVPCQTTRAPVSYLPPETLREIYGAINDWAEHQPANGHHVVVRRHRPLWALISDSTGGFCPVGLSSLALLDDGTILPCRRLEIPIGNALSDRGLFKAWYTSDLLWKIRAKRGLAEQCRSCGKLDRCGGCRAIAHAVTGNYLEGDPQCWSNHAQS